jgi:hypothetical protein
MPHSWAAQGVGRLCFWLIHPRARLLPLCSMFMAAFSKLTRALLERVMSNGLLFAATETLRPFPLDNYTPVAVCNMCRIGEFRVR